MTTQKSGLDVYTPENAVKWNLNGGADRTARPWVVEQVANLSGSGERKLLLDIGSGTGRWTKQFGQYMNHVVGIDICPEMIRIARETNPAQNVQYIHGNFLKLIGIQFDIVTALASLQHTKSREELNEAYANASARLVPGGHFIFYTPHPIGTFARKNRVYGVEFDKGVSYNDNFPYVSKILMEDGTTRSGSGYHHSMAEYVGDLTRHGFKINKMEEFFAEGDIVPNALVVAAQKIGGEE